MFHDHPLFTIAHRQMLNEMVQFPWQALDAAKEENERMAQVAGFSTSRQADAEQVAHAKAIARRILNVGQHVNSKSTILLTVSDDCARKPRSRGLVLALQALVNAGLPAFISDRTELPKGDRPKRYAADLVIILPRL